MNKAPIPIWVLGPNLDRQAPGVLRPGHRDSLLREAALKTSSRARDWTLPNTHSSRGSGGGHGVPSKETPGTDPAIRAERPSLDGGREGSRVLERAPGLFEIPKITCVSNPDFSLLSLNLDRPLRVTHTALRPYSGETHLFSDSSVPPRGSDLPEALGHLAFPQGQSVPTGQ